MNISDKSFETSKSKNHKIDLSKVKRYSLDSMQHKISIQDFGHPVEKIISGEEFLNSLPNILIGKDLRDIVNHAIQAYENSMQITFALGGHVVKTGTGPHLIRLMEEGVITSLVLNGAFAIHDFEVALIGKTSEIVDDALQKGSFGFALETGSDFNCALKRGWEKGLGYAEAIATYMIENNFPYIDNSILASAFKLGITTTVHSAIGAEIIYQHPECPAEAIGELQMRDFHSVINLVANLSGGMWFNVGSAVLLPEIFLKAMSVAINLGADPMNFVTVYMDMIQHYRPDQNVVRRPVVGRGKGYHLIGHHELMIPLLSWIIKHRVAA